MAVHIKRKAGMPTNNVVHSVPCHIQMDGDALVSKFFNPYIKNDGEVLKASFRGYPLVGKLLQLPEGYRGIIIQETMKSLSEEAERNVHVTHSFKSFTYWNWDKTPSKNDVFLSALDWIDVSEAAYKWDQSNNCLPFSFIQKLAVDSTSAAPHGM